MHFLNTEGKEQLSQKNKFPLSKAARFQLHKRGLCGGTRLLGGIRVQICVLLNQQQNHQTVRSGAQLQRGPRRKGNMEKKPAEEISHKDLNCELCALARALDHVAAQDGMGEHQHKHPPIFTAQPLRAVLIVPDGNRDTWGVHKIIPPGLQKALFAPLKAKHQQATIYTVPWYWICCLCAFHCAIKGIAKTACDVCVYIEMNLPCLAYWKATRRNVKGTCTIILSSLYYQSAVKVKTKNEHTSGWFGVIVK